MESKDKQKENLELLIRGIRRQAAEAREDVAKFFEFVIREENEKTKLKVTPHQILFFSFTMHHHKSVVRQPAGTSKTFCIATEVLYFLGKDCTQRGAIVSAAESLAKKPLKMVSDYITEPALNSRLIQVFPRLQRSPRSSDPWSTINLVVDRPAGIRDPSLAAVGIATKFEGSRWSFVSCDDLVTIANSSDPEMRNDMNRKFSGLIASRLDPHKGRVIITNVPWHREDLTFYLENLGWPTLVMNIYGDIRIENAEAVWMKYALDHLLRPSTKRFDNRYDWYRLRAHDPDPEEEVPLFPQRFNQNIIADIKRTYHPLEFARQFLCEPLSSETARCQQEWIEKCKIDGLGLSMPSEYSGHNPTFTGIDIGIGNKRKHDKTSMVTIEIIPDARFPHGRKRFLNIDSGRWNGPEIVNRAESKHSNYGSFLIVEANQGQKFIADFAKEKNKELPIRAIPTTAANKHNIDFGIESIFNEFHNSEYIIPCDDKGKCHPEMQALIDEALFYDPLAHTGDRLMALWIAREGARKNISNQPRPRSGLPRHLPNHLGGF